MRERPGPGPCEHCATGANANADTKADEDEADEDEADNENPGRITEGELTRG